MGDSTRPYNLCNLSCKGCWSAEYGNNYNLSFETIDSIIKQGKALGTYIYIYTGGEPLVRKSDLIKLCEIHDDCIFLTFTNGTLIDDEFCIDIKRVKNLIPAITHSQLAFSYLPQDNNINNIVITIVPL